MYLVKKEKAPHTEHNVSRREIKGHGDLEIRPVLLQFGIVHVDGEKLKIQTYTQSVYEL